MYPSVENTDNGRGSVCGGNRVYGNFLYSLQFCCEPKPL